MWLSVGGNAGARRAGAAGHHDQLGAGLRELAARAAEGESLGRVGNTAPVAIPIATCLPTRLGQVLSDSVGGSCRAFHASLASSLPAAGAADTERLAAIQVANLLLLVVLLVVVVVVVAVLLPT